MEFNQSPEYIRATIERSDEMVDSLQFLREFYWNTCEAGAELCEFGFVAITTEDGKLVLKMSCSDGGNGMGCKKLVKLMNTLGQSTKDQNSLDGSFGWGARIAALGQSRFGLVVISKAKRENPTLVRIFKQNKTGEFDNGDDGFYELQTFENGLNYMEIEPTVTTVVPGLGSFRLADTVGRITKPGESSLLFGESWTVFMICGNAAEEHTASTSNPNDSNSVLRYLNKKLVHAPTTIRIVSPRSADRATWGEIGLPIRSGGGGRTTGDVDSHYVHPLAEKFHEDDDRIYKVINLSEGVRAHLVLDTGLDLDRPKADRRLGFCFYGLGNERMLDIAEGNALIPLFTGMGIYNVKAHKAIAVMIELPMAKRSNDVGARVASQLRNALNWKDANGQKSDLPVARFLAEIKAKLPKEFKEYLRALQANQNEKRDARYVDGRKSVLSLYGSELKRFLCETDPNGECNDGDTAENEMETRTATVVPARSDEKGGDLGGRGKGGGGGGGGPSDGPGQGDGNEGTGDWLPDPVETRNKTVKTKAKDQGGSGGSNIGKPKEKDVSGPEVEYDLTKNFFEGKPNTHLATYIPGEQGKWGVLYIDAQSEVLSMSVESLLPMYGAENHDNIKEDFKSFLRTDTLRMLCETIASLSRLGHNIESKAFTDWTDDGPLSHTLTTSVILSTLADVKGHLTKNFGKTKKG